MLHRGFKSAKCKTSLKLAVSRIKLLKNKREAQLKQMKRDVAQLLESGKDQTAKIRVEHVVREEKTMAAYDLVEVYCELIAARLPIIESQKNCPIDLKEAITSVIFASPRCSDIPELMDIRKHFTAKYGKDFISAAVELRPDCGVSRNLVEKLSVKAPDGLTKIKILGAIAEEHNVKWEPKSFEEKESKPPEVMLSGPDTFEEASKMQVEPPNVQAVPSSGQKPEVPANLCEHARRPLHSSQDMSFSSQNIHSRDFGANKATMSGSSQPRSSGTSYEEMDFSHSYSGNENSFSPGGQNWNMEFKDATAAAQAAAESAERASMAARAAAELSSRGKTNSQYSMESQRLSDFGLRDEGPGKYAGSKLEREHLSKVSAHNSFHDRNPMTWNVRMDRNQQDDLEGASEKLYRNGNGRKSSRSSSLKSNSFSIDELNPGQKSDSYSQRSSSAVEATKQEKGSSFLKVSMEKQSEESEVGFLGEQQDGMNTGNVDHLGNAKIKRESSTISSHSYSSAVGNAYDEISDLNDLRFQNDAGENPFAGTVPGNLHRDSREAHSSDNTGVVFDEYGSDDDGHRFDDTDKDDGGEFNTYFRSPGKRLPSHLLANTSACSPKQNRNESVEQVSSQTEWQSSRVFSENLTKSNASANTSTWSPRQNRSEFMGIFSSPHDESVTKSNSVASSQLEDLPLTFDDSDGLSSESEKEPERHRISERKDPSIPPLSENVYARTAEPTQSETHELGRSTFREKGDSGSNRKQWLDSSSDESDAMLSNRGLRAKFKARSQKKFGLSDMSTSQSSPKWSESILDQNAKDSEPFYEEKHLQSQQSSRHSLVHEWQDKEDIHATDSPSIMKNTGVLDESSNESEKELNFGTLTGGLRNKGYNRPPNVSSPSSNTSTLSKQATDDASATPQHSIASSATQQFNSSMTVESLGSYGASNREAHNQDIRAEVNKKSSSRASVTYIGSDSDDSEEELPERPQPRNQKESYNQGIGLKVNAKLSSRSPNTYFDTDSEEDIPKPTHTSKGRPVSNFSRRTKASPSFGTSSYSKSALASDVSATSNAERKLHSRRSYTTETANAAQSSAPSSGPQEGKPSSRRSYTTETVPEARSLTGSSGWQERKQGSGWQRSSEQAASKPIPEPQASEKESSKFLAMEQQSNPPKIISSGNAESSKTSSTGTPSRENSMKKAGHVHPKLPDYETLAAQLQSLRVNRQ